MTRRKTVSKILEIKEFYKEQLETEVKKATARLNTEEDNLAALERHYQQAIDTLSLKQSGGPVPVRELELFDSYLRHLVHQIVHQEGVVAIRTGELEEKKQAMIGAYKEQRIFEILNDRLRQAQQKQENLDEQKQRDYQHLAGKAKR